MVRKSMNAFLPLHIKLASNCVITEPLLSQTTEGRSSEHACIKTGISSGVCTRSTPVHQWIMHQSSSDDFQSSAMLRNLKNRRNAQVLRAFIVTLCSIHADENDIWSPRYPDRQKLVGFSTPSNEEGA